MKAHGVTLVICVGIALVWPGVAQAKCRPNGGEIGYSFCARFRVTSTGSWWTKVTRFYFIENYYGTDRVLTADVQSVQLPLPELQAADAKQRMKIGDSIRIGVSQLDNRTVKAGDEIFGLLEVECYDAGEPDFAYMLNGSLSAHAYESSGTIRRKNHLINCEQFNQPAAIQSR